MANVHFLHVYQVSDFRGSMLVPQIVRHRMFYEWERFVWSSCQNVSKFKFVVSWCRVKSGSVALQINGLS